jgi:hypothetical protein
MIRSLFSALGMLIRLLLALILIAGLALSRVLRGIQMLAAHAAGRRKWHYLLAVHARVDRRHS